MKKVQPVFSDQSCPEVFADYAFASVVAGTVRIEFCSFRMSSEDSSKLLRVPVARIVLTRSLCKQLGPYFEKLLAAVDDKKEPPAPVSEPTVH
jgi:hypothetical protein